MGNKSVGIIGCGLIADTHVEAIIKILPDAKISVCDPLPGKAELLRKKYNLKSAYTDIDTLLLQEDPFSVHILTPPRLHFAHALQCLNAGCHILIEKPLCFSYADAEKIYDVAKQADRVLCVDHSLFCQPSVIKMFELLKSQNDNRILYVNSFYGLNIEGQIPLSIQKNHWKQCLPGGALMDSIIHPVSLAVGLTGKPLDIKTNYIEADGNIEEVHTSWQSDHAMASITVSKKGEPFRRFTEIVTTRLTFVIDHSTETLVVLAADFGPKSFRKVIVNLKYAHQLFFGTVRTVMNVMRGRLKQNPGTRGLVERFYKYLDGKGAMPVSKENVINSVLAIEKISTDLDKVCWQSSAQEDKPEKRPTCSQIGDSPAILVTGASGFLGYHICEILVRRNRRVVAQVRRGPNADKLTFPNLERRFDDFIYESFDFSSLVDNTKEIIHCTHAAGVRTWNEIKRINVDATLSLYDAATDAGCEKFVFVSSVAVYGVHQKGQASVSEETPGILGRSSWDYYVRSKTMAENLLLERAKRGGPKLVIIRPGILYATDGTRLARKSIPIKGGRLFIIFGNGKNHLPYTRVDVLAETICRMLDCNPFPEGVYNLTGNPKESSKDFITVNMKNRGIECKFLSLPSGPLRLAAIALELIYKISHRRVPPKITRYVIDSSTRDIKYDTTKAERILGWNPDAAVASN